MFKEKSLSALSMLVPNTRKLFCSAAISAISVFALPTHAAPTTFVSIGTGGQTGVYYVVGQSICRLVNRDFKTNNIKCTASSSGGSVANINGIRSGNFDLGVAQSDWVHHAKHGTSKFAEQGPDSELRLIFSVHNEPLTVIARKDAHVSSFEDLKGKRVNVGVPGAGSRATLEVLMDAVGMDMSDYKLAAELATPEQAQALCDNKLDAVVYVAGHPNGSIKEASSSCETNLVSVEGPGVDKLIAASPYYAKAVVPGGMYEGTPADTATFGVGATFATSTNTSPDVVYAIVKSVFENFEQFKRLHPSFANLTIEKMISDNISAPLHDGAVRYYKEKGWL